MTTICLAITTFSRERDWMKQKKHLCHTLKGYCCLNSFMTVASWITRNICNKKAQLTQRERATAVHVWRPAANKCKIRKNLYFSAQGHSRSLLSVSIKTRIVINCNLGPISHRFRDMASYWFKIAKFSYPPHLGPSIGVTPMEFWKSVTDPETRVFGAADGEDLMIHPCDRQTDRRTDGQNCDG